MIEHEELSESFQILQQSGLNCGGMWKVRSIKKTLEDQEVLNALINEFNKSTKYDNLDKYIEHQKLGGWNPEEQRLTKNIELIFIENWEIYLSERLDFWSNFELISKDEMMKSYNFLIS